MAPKKHLMLVSSGGGDGKTSAALALYCKLANAEASDAAKPIIPVFVPLPRVKGLLATPAALEAEVHDGRGVDCAISRRR